MKSETRTKRIQDLKDECKALWAKLDRAGKELSALEDEEVEERRSEVGEITPEKYVTLPHELFDGSSAAVKSADAFMAKYKYLYRGGYMQATMTQVVKITFNSDEPVEPQIAEVMQFLPYIKYCRIEAKRSDRTLSVRYLDIFERSLSAHGIFFLGVDASDRAYLCKTTYGRTEILQEGPVEDMLKYIHKHHPYEGGTEMESSYYEED